MKVEGMDLFYAESASGSVKKAGCLFELDLGTDSVEGRERVCIGASSNRSEAGKFTWGQTTIGVEFDNLDAYEDFKAFFKDRVNDIHLCVALSDGTATPTLSSGSWTATDRSLLTMTGYVESVQWGSEDNGNWRGTFVIQRQSGVEEDFA